MGEIVKDKKLGISDLKIAVVVAQDRNGNMVARKGGTGRVKAEEIDAVIGEFILYFAQIQQPTIKSLPE
jgi:hypothetical protein